VIRYRLFALRQQHGGRGISEGFRDQIARLTLPVEAVLLAWRADDLLGIFQDTVGVTVVHRVFHLCFDVAAADVDGGQLVAANAARQHLHPALRAVKVPAPIPPHQGNRERPVVVANHQSRSVRVARFGLHAHTGAGASGELFPHAPVFLGIARFDDVLRAWTE